MASLGYFSIIHLLWKKIVQCSLWHPPRAHWHVYETAHAHFTKIKKLDIASSVKGYR